MTLTICAHCSSLRSKETAPGTYVEEHTKRFGLNSSNSNKALTKNFDYNVEIEPDLPSSITDTDERNLYMCGFVATAASVKSVFGKTQLVAVSLLRFVAKALEEDITESERERQGVPPVTPVTYNSSPFRTLVEIEDFDVPKFAQSVLDEVVMSDEPGFANTL